MSPYIRELFGGSFASRARQLHHTPCLGSDREPRTELVAQALLVRSKARRVCVNGVLS